MMAPSVAMARDTISVIIVAFITIVLSGHRKVRNYDSLLPSSKESEKIEEQVHEIKIKIKSADDGELVCLL